MNVIIFDSIRKIPISAYVGGSLTLWTEENGEQVVHISHRKRSAGLKKKLSNNQAPQNVVYPTSNVTDGDDIPEFDLGSWDSSAEWAEFERTDFESGGIRGHAIN
jgi:hypothetical protein